MSNFFFIFILFIYLFTVRIRRPRPLSASAFQRVLFDLFVLQSNLVLTQKSQRVAVVMFLSRYMKVQQATILFWSHSSQYLPPTQPCPKEGNTVDQSSNSCLIYWSLSSCVLAVRNTVNFCESEKRFSNNTAFIGNRKQTNQLSGQKKVVGFGNSSWLINKMVIDKVVAFKQEVLASTPPPRRKRKKAFGVLFWYDMWRWSWNQVLKGMSTEIWSFSFWNSSFVFFFGSLLFFFFLISISYNFGAMEVIAKISKMVDPWWRLYAQMASYDAITDKWPSYLVE